VHSQEIHLDGASAPGAPRLVIVPTPFNPSASIRVDSPMAGRVRLAVYDIRGKLIRDLVDADLPRGSHQVFWDGRDAAGMPVASGNYFARLETSSCRLTRQMMLVR